MCRLFLWGLYTGRGENGFGISDLGLREGVPLMRHELYMGNVLRRGEITGCGMRGAGCGKVSMLMHRRIFMGILHRRI